MDWTGKVALVTGASAGIGEAVAEELGRLGMKLAITARREDRLRTLANRLSDQGVESLVLPADVRDVDACVEVCEHVRRAWGGIDVMVNNAGLARRAPLMSGETELWREVLEVNVLALAVFTREAIEDMRANGDRGHVVHIASMAAHRVPPGQGGMYAATKHAVRALTEGLRHELRAADSAIRVSAISPGFVETEFAEVFLDGDKEGAAEVYSHFPCLQPADIAKAVRYVLEQPPHVQVHDVLMRPTQQPT